MRIVEYYSHLNGWEHIQVHKHHLWTEIEQVISSIDASKHRDKESQEQGTMGKLLYAPKSLNVEFKRLLNAHGWKEQRTTYWITKNQKLIRKTLTLSADEQKRMIQESGEVALRSYNQTDFEKDRVAIEVQMGKYTFVAFDLFVKHMAFFVRDVIDVGIEIVPMKEMQAEMASGPAHYEGCLYDLLRQGRSTPAVPLVLIGIAP